MADIINNKPRDFGDQLCSFRPLADGIRSMLIRIGSVQVIDTKTGLLSAPKTMKILPSALVKDQVVLLIEI